MSTLPTPPACGEPATVRIELYTADSLDACAYTCAAHTIHVTAVVVKAGMDAHPVGMAPDVDRPCGYVHVYPTGTLATEPADLTHPRWCDRGDCARRGRHRSPALHLDTNRPEAFIVDVALVQALHPAAAPMVALTSVEGSATACLLLSVGQARVLRYRLGNLIDMTKATRNGGRWT
ncbi:hypothetical protein GA0070607_3743 [Micromonospora coriariae]|uniref:Uncharacterized protein n=1 Tax=Micromonospora coriariae TaxID=285665 RepID=A0A1C4WJQ8_9ACTN|nr:hypothetical protein [Micromonospora coriariae]SCE96404.1 hypothetical protein GA0070607_3743 [Micromonospora coriariae]